MAGSGNRTVGQGYVADGVRQKFTQKERDIETGLDYFLARYYSSTQGRFTSPDEFTGGPDELFDFANNAAENPTLYADLTNPQSLNKYHYSYNNPLRYTDPDGHCPDCEDIVDTVVDTVGGILRGGASSLSLGAVGAPQPTDSTASRVGQIIGSVGVAVVGVQHVGGGTIGGILTSETVVGAEAGAVTAAIGAGEIAGGVRNLGAIATTPMRNNNTSDDPKPVSKKEAVREAHNQVGKQTERGTGKFGSPMRGNSKKGYRLDPPNPNGKGLEKTHRHVNWWDFTKGKKGSGGRKGYVPINNF